MGKEIERVARDICVSRGGNPDEIVSGDYWTFRAEEPVSGAVPDMIYWEPRWKAYQRQALAALSAKPGRGE
jgi:hypothetical protein